MGNSIAITAMKTTLHFFNLAIFAKLNSAFTIPENEAKVMLKFSKPLPSIMDHVVEKHDNWWESNFRKSNLERECVEEDCYLEEYIESAENNLHNLLPDGVKILDMRDTLDPENQWYDRRVKANFDHFYTNCLPTATSMDAVRMCLNMADDSLSTIFRDPKLPGEEQRPIFGETSDEVETTVESTQDLTTLAQNETIINIEELNNVNNNQPETESEMPIVETTSVLESIITNDNAFETSESVTENDRNARIDLDIDELTGTTESKTTSPAVTAERIAETTAEMYNIVTFGINPDGSLFYDEADRKTEPVDKKSQPTAKCTNVDGSPCKSDAKISEILAENERNARIDLDIDELNDTNDTTESTKTSMAELVNETTAEIYNIVTFGVNPDGSLFYNNADRKTKSADKDSQLSEMISAFEQDERKWYN